MKRIAAIQMTSSEDVAKNLQEAERLILKAAALGAQLVVLPENFALMGKTEQDKLKISETFGEGPIQDFLAKQAAKNKIWLVGGTIPITSENPQKVYAACLIYNAHGDRVARYDKIHLFDAQVKRDVEVYEESNTTEYGDHLTVVDTPFGRLGVAVCYDIRFPELFRAMLVEKVDIIAVPAAFTVKTGEAHWEVLMRARAIENFCYIIGACQTGTHTNGRQTYGHALIVNPWGETLTRLTTQVDVITATIDHDKQHQMREDFPTALHQRIGIDTSKLK